MKLSRYIKFPLLFGLLMTVPALLNPSVNNLLIAFVYGAVVGIGLQFYSDYKTRKIKPDANEKDFTVNQAKRICLFCDYETAFRLCLESVESLKKGRIIFADKERSLIKAGTGMSANSWGNSIEFKLKKMTENSTEIEISVTPSFKTTLIDYGESAELMETVVSLLEKQNDNPEYNKISETESYIPINIISNTFENIKARK